MALPDSSLPAAGESPALDWHAHPAEEVASFLDVDVAQGLSEPEVTRRLALHGENRPAQDAGTPAWRRFLEQFTQPLVLVLVASGAITLALGEHIDASVIFGVVLANACIGFWQEAKAESALARLAASLATPAIVRRDGHRRQVDAVTLVPGDVVILTAGDRVPADLRLLNQAGLMTDESLLTGESLPVSKHPAALSAETPAADRLNMLFAGSNVVAGQALGIVVTTGGKTEAGKIGVLMKSVGSLATPLTRKMARFSNWLLQGIGALAALTFVVGLMRGESAYGMFMAVVALAIGAIPEGLPAAVTVTLAIGVARMARRRAVIRHLPAVETLGSTTVICTDKTGTLTENAMTVRSVWCAGQAYTFTGHGYAPTGEIQREGGIAAIDSPLRDCLVAGALCNNASLRHEARQWQITGDPTEAALLVAARKAGLEEHTLKSLFPRLAELPFDAEHCFMATAHRDEEQGVLYVKGALEALLPRCQQQLSASGMAEACDRAAVEEAAHALAGDGMRVLLLARRHLPTPHAGKQVTPALLQDLTLLGLVAMIDPPRPAAISAVRNCHAAGIQVKMITGDHLATATAIARQFGIETEGALTGRELAALTDEQLREAAATARVFARVAPEQKLRLVRALQTNGQIVAMTGDGVNDAPALKQADIGIAMGLGGTEVAKEAADMVLTDDNFASIEAAVEEGRGVWDNLVKFITWTLPTNFGEGLVIAAAILLGVTLPITPLQILWINMTTAVLLGLPLAFEPLEPGIMRRTPRRPEQPVLDATLIRRIVIVSLLLLAGAFGLFINELNQGHSVAQARTVAVNVFVFVEGAYLFNCRSLTQSFWRAGLFSNLWLWGGVGIMLLLQLLLTYWPPLNAAFQTEPIGWREWGYIVGVAWLSGLVIALEKRWTRPSRST